MSALDIEKEVREFIDWMTDTSRPYGQCFDPGRMARWPSGAFDDREVNSRWQGWLAAKRAAQPAEGAVINYGSHVDNIAAQPAITDEPMGYAMFRNGKQVGIERSQSQADRWVDAVAVPLWPINASAAQPVAATAATQNYSLDALAERLKIASFVGERIALDHHQAGIVGAALAAHVSGQGEPEEIDPGSLYAVRTEWPDGHGYWQLAIPSGDTWMSRDDLGWSGPVKCVVEWHKLTDPVRSVLDNIPEEGVSGQGGDDAFALGWQQALSDAAFYVAGHCANGDHHAEIIMDLRQPAFAAIATTQSKEKA